MIIETTINIVEYLLHWLPTCGRYGQQPELPTCVHSIAGLCHFGNNVITGMCLLETFVIRWEIIILCRRRRKIAIACYIITEACSGSHL
jgi:hypothetical protein